MEYEDVSAFGHWAHIDCVQNLIMRLGFGRTNINHFPFQIFLQLFNALECQFELEWIEKAARIVEYDHIRYVYFGHFCTSTTGFLRVPNVLDRFRKSVSHSKTQPVCSLTVFSSLRRTSQIMQFNKTISSFHTACSLLYFSFF